MEAPLQRELTNKWHAQCATGILNAPDPSYNPLIDRHLTKTYGPETQAVAKRINKATFQKMLGLVQDENAPLFLWPSRLDPVQKGCQQFAEIFYAIISKYYDQNLEIVFVADGEYQGHFRDIVNFHQFHDRVAVCNFNQSLEHLGYGASDFILMPSSFEPCGLPQMIAPIYGSLPVAHDTGGIHDTITQLNIAENAGNGFLFKHFDVGGLYWAIEEAMRFHSLSAETKDAQIQRIMTQSINTFNHANTAGQYSDLYEKMLQRPLIN